MATSKPDRINLGVRLPADLYDQLVDAAAERDLSANYLMTRAIADFLDRLIPADELRFTRDR